jgi:hypothetical protein
MLYLQTAIGANIRAQCYKTFYDRNLLMFVISETVRMFVHGKPLKPSLRLCARPERTRLINTRVCSWPYPQASD